MVCLTCLASGVLLVVVLTASPAQASLSKSSYLSHREQLIRRDTARRIGGVGGRGALGAGELSVETRLMQEKRRVIDEARFHHGDFPPARNFLVSRPAMETSEVFRILRKMPKGGLLHVHTRALVDLDWVIKNATYRPDLYMCMHSEKGLLFHFFAEAPVHSECTWTLVSAERAKKDPEAFDQLLYNSLTLIRPDPAAAYPDIASVWDQFEVYFSALKGLMMHTPVWRDYLVQALTQCLQDNVQYVELKNSVPTLYDLDGTVRDGDWTIGVLTRDVINQFKANHTEFIGAKVILSTYRGLPPEVVFSDLKEAMALYQKYPDVVIGFDLVGFEDTLSPLTDFVDALLYPSLQDPPVHLPYFFHAGETTWQGTSVDYNLADALLLNASRIGHGFALVKHPTFMDEVKERGVAVEVSPISNQVLKLVDDLRNHPAAVLIADNFPVVINSDDPAVWSALPLTHDFYVTFMALIGQDAGLNTLKQLAFNSLRHSGMNCKEKRHAFRKWNRSWNKFIEEFRNH